MGNSNTEFVEALVEAYRGIPIEHKTQIDDFIQGELMMGHLPLCNEHSAAFYFMENCLLEGNEFIDVADAIFHKGESALVPIMFSPAALSGGTPQGIKGGIQEFVTTIDAIAGHIYERVPLNRSIVVLPTSIGVAFAAKAIPAMPITVGKSFEATHDLMHQNDEFEGGEHKNLINSIERWLTGGGA